MEHNGELVLCLFSHLRIIPEPELSLPTMLSNVILFFGSGSLYT